MYFIPIKNIYASKGTINSVKRQPTEWEYVFANRIFNKELIYRKLLQLNNKKQTTRDFAGGPVAKNPPANAGDTGSIPGLGPVGHNY